MLPTSATVDDSASLEHERFSSLINSMADGVIATDEKCVIVFYNAAALDIFDLNISLEGKSLSTISKVFDANGQPIDIEGLIKRVKTVTSTRDYVLHYADGSKANLYLNIAPVRLGYGQTGESGYVLIFRDITHEKSLEEERTEFISVVSHELRTPIAITEGNISNAEFIAQKSGNIDQVKQALKEAHSQVNFLSDMINDLAALSRAERGKLAVETAPINIHDLVNALTANYQPQAAEKGLELRSEIDPNLEPLMSGELYVREILQNFITNSIKYTQQGSVTIHATQQAKGVEFQISDTGIGISKTDQEKVFDKFFRSEDYRTRASKGTGLGLYITMKLARLLHADIKLESELNRGSTFTIFVPNLQ